MITQRDRVAALAAEGLPQCDIARRLGVTRQRVSQIVQQHSIECERSKPNRKLSEQTRRILDAAPALAERGLSKTEAARELGVSPDVFRSAVKHRLPDVEWRNGSRRFSSRTTRVLKAAPALAERGLSKSDVARELGVPRMAVVNIVRRYMPDVEWRDGRARAPSTTSAPPCGA